MWYQFQPNTELLKQANVWNGLSQSIKDFFEGAERNELAKINKQNTQLYMDKIRQDMQQQAEIHPLNMDSMRQDMQQKAEIHPLTIQGLQTQNAYNAHKFKMASLFDKAMHNADLAHKRALTNYTNRQTANIGRSVSSGSGNNALETAKALAGIARNFTKTPAQIQQERDALKEQIIKQYPFLDDNSDIVEQMISDYTTYGTHNTPSRWPFDSYEPLADTKDAGELEKLRRLRAQNDPSTQLNNAIMQILGLQGGMLGTGYIPPQAPPRKDSPNEKEAAKELKNR